MMMELEDFRQSVVAARGRIEQYIHKTPLEVSYSLSQETGAQVYLKLENEQVTGAVKVRGALNKLKLVQSSGRYDASNPLITASSGNHALACTYAMKKLDMKIRIYVAETISLAKDQALKQAGADLVHHGMELLEAEKEARKMVKESGSIFVSSYNDTEIMAGQGTVGMEILEDLPDVDAVFVSVGGGGMIGGIGAYIKALRPNVRIVGCQPRNSPVMYESVKAGKVIEFKCLDTLSEGTAGNMEKNNETLSYNCHYVDDWVLVDEDEISQGVYTVLKHHHKVIEGSAGVVIAAFRQVAAQYKDQKVALVMCGANIGMEKLKEIIHQNMQWTIQQNMQ